MTVPSVEPISPAQFGAARERIARIEQAASAPGGHPALGDAVWRDLDSPGADSAGFFVDDAAYAHVARADNDTTPAHWALGVTVTPEAHGTAARLMVIEAAIVHVQARGGGIVTLWLLGAGDGDDDELAGVGLAPDRDLYEMRVPLPVAERPRWPAGFEVRPFEVGRDEAAWLDVNNQAFAAHAEQGGWTKETLARRTTEPWFDPTIFLLAFDDQGLAGFNWMRLHDEHGSLAAPSVAPLRPHDQTGEIYVIGVAPRTQGSGLGRALAIGGLDAVHARGVATGSLFCAADNEAALHLYRSLGFTVHRVDRAYEREVASP